MLPGKEGRKEGRRGWEEKKKKKKFPEKKIKKISQKARALGKAPLTSSARPRLCSPAPGRVEKEIGE